MTETVLVTGATGTVGRHVVTALGDRDVAVRPGVHDPETVPEEIAGIGDSVAFDFAKPETWGRALRDVDGIFLVRPPVVDRSAIESFVDAADRVGVPRLTYLSTLGAEKNVLVPHHWIEKRIMATDIEYTLLRSSFFMQNLLEVHRRDIVDHDEIFVPAGSGKTSFVDARDLGEAAAVVLTESGHANQAYDLTGPDALDYETVASIFSDVLDRSITYPEPSLLRFARRMHGRGESLGFITLMCGIYTTARLGLADRVTDDSERLLGRPPGGMRAFVEDHAAAFRGAADPTAPSGGVSETEGSDALDGSEPKWTQQSDGGSVEALGPPIPDAAYEVINPVMSVLLRSPLHSLVSDSLVLLTFTGSKTGNEYTTPVGYWVKDGHLIVTTQSPWWRNLQGGQPVSLYLQGAHRDGTATPHPDPTDVARYVMEIIERHGMTAARRLGIRIHGDREPTHDELEAGVEGTVVIDIELTDSKPPVRD